MSELAKWMVSEPSEYLSWLLNDNRTRQTDSRRISESSNFRNGVRAAV